MMFELPQNKITTTDLPIIANNYTVLHFDEFPMLFCGNNQYGNYIIGSLLCEDEEKDIFRYLHLIVKPYDFESFIKKQISYLNLIKNQIYIYN